MNKGRLEESCTYLKWFQEIKAAIEQAVFFVPIVTPTALRSRHCKFEFDSFLARESELGRADLVFPVLYIRVPALEDEKLWRGDPVLGIIRKYGVNIEEYHFQNVFGAPITLQSNSVLATNGRLHAHILAALR